MLRHCSITGQFCKIIIYNLLKAQWHQMCKTAKAHFIVFVTKIKCFNGNDDIFIFCKTQLQLNNRKGKKHF